MQNGFSKTGDNCYGKSCLKNQKNNLKQRLPILFMWNMYKNGHLKLYKGQISNESLPMRLYTSAGVLLLERSLPNGN
jgi:hypothetical protein